MELTDNKNITRWESEGKAYILVGTAHVSRHSRDLVRAVIENEKPDTVCVELCDSRYQAIIEKSRWQQMDIVKVIKEKKAFLLLSNLLLASFQRRLAQKLEVRPGEEMIAAVECGQTVGARIHLADRDIRITLSRAWRSMGLWDKVKLLSQMILSFGEVDDIEAEDVEKLKQQDILESLMADISRKLPVIKTILIDERDRYLAEKIRTADGRKIVAVVGAGHVPGIRRHWGVPTDLTPLETIPRAGKFSVFFKWGLPIMIVALIFAGAYVGGTKAGAEMAFSWIFTNSVLSGIGAMIALAHPLTILSSMAAAPFTALHPLIAVGWVAGLVEAGFRKPKVIDFETLAEDILSIRGFWKNKITRVLLVVVFTNLGNSIGTFVAIPLMLKSMG